MLIKYTSLNLRNRQCANRVDWRIVCAKTAAYTLEVRFELKCSTTEHKIASWACFPVIEKCWFLCVHKSWSVWDIINVDKFSVPLITLVQETRQAEWVIRGQFRVCKVKPYRLKVYFRQDKPWWPLRSYVSLCSCSVDISDSGWCLIFWSWFYYRSQRWQIQTRCIINAIGMLLMLVRPSQRRYISGTFDPSSGTLLALWDRFVTLYLGTLIVTRFAFQHKENSAHTPRFASLTPWSGLAPLFLWRTRW